MKPYNPNNWYWYVAGDQTKAFSSKAGDYVQSGDETFQAWIAAGGVPTNIASEAELGEVLAAVSARPIAAGILDGYKDTRVNKISIQDVAVYLFNLENRMRAAERAAGLNGSPANLTANQFRNMLRNMV